MQALANIVGTPGSDRTRENIAVFDNDFSPIAAPGLSRVRVLVVAYLLSYYTCTG